MSTIVAISHMWLFKFKWVNIQYNLSQVIRWTCHNSSAQQAQVASLSEKLHFKCYLIFNYCNGQYKYRTFPSLQKVLLDSVDLMLTKLSLIRKAVIDIIVILNLSLPVTDWMFVSSPKCICWTLIPNVMAFGEGLCEVIRSPSLPYSPVLSLPLHLSTRADSEEAGVHQPGSESSPGPGPPGLDMLDFSTSKNHEKWMFFVWDIECTILLLHLPALTKTRPLYQAAPLCYQSSERLWRVTASLTTATGWTGAGK